MQWMDLATKGGAYVAPFLMGAILWLLVDRKRLVEENKQKDTRLVDLAERAIAVNAEIRMFLFQERKA